MIITFATQSNKKKHREVRSVQRIARVVDWQPFGVAVGAGLPIDD